MSPGPAVISPSWESRIVLCLFQGFPSLPAPILPTTKQRQSPEPELPPPGLRRALHRPCTALHWLRTMGSAGVFPPDSLNFSACPAPVLPVPPSPMLGACWEPAPPSPMPAACWELWLGRDSWASIEKDWNRNQENARTVGAWHSGLPLLLPSASRVECRAAKPHPSLRWHMETRPSFPCR